MTRPGNPVFVYGTLRPGGSNAFRMEGAESSGPATVTGWLYRISWYPGLVPDPEGGLVHGHLFYVSAAQLAGLDEFEGIPAGELAGTEYRRTLVQVQPLQGEEPVQAWVYVWLGETSPEQLLSHGDWLRA